MTLSMPRPHVVILDDNEKEMQFCEAVLRKKFEVTTFALSNIDEPGIVLEIERLSPRPVAILLDVVKDDVYGREGTFVGLLSALRARFRGQVAIFAISSKVDDASTDIVLNWFRNGIDDWIWKDPLHLSRMDRTLEAAIKCASSLRETRRPQSGVFISHGGSTREDKTTLKKMTRLLEACGARPIIVERTTSGGRSVNQQVRKRLAESDAAVILATRDRRSRNPKAARGNVINEMGLIQERLPEKFVLLLEDGCQLPTNLQELVHARFTADNMEDAFLKTIAELRSFDVI